MRIKEYLKFRQIFKHYIKTGDMFFHSSQVGMHTSDLYYLQAKGVIEIVPFSNGDPDCKIIISPKGLTYRDTVFLWLFQTFLPIALSVAALVVSIVKD